MFKTSFAAVLFATAAEASLRMGSCPSYTRMETFDVERYMGKWYEISRDKLTIYDAKSIFAGCGSADYKLNDDGTVGVWNRAHYPMLGWDGLEGKAITSNVTGPASLVVSFSGEPDADRVGNYDIIDTDYDSYVIVYTCREVMNGMANYDLMYILGREPTLPEEKWLEIIGIMNEKVPGYDFFPNVHTTRQNNVTCPYDGEPPAP